MPLHREIQRDLDLATASWLASRKTDRPQVSAEFWRYPQLPKLLEKTANSLGVPVDRALTPAAWRNWLSQLTPREYSLAKTTNQRSGVAQSFFAALEKSAVADLWLVKTEHPVEVQPHRVGLLDVVPGVVRLACGETPLLWVGGETLSVSGLGEIPRDQDGGAFEIVCEPIVLGRTQLEKTDADEATTHLSEQFTLLRNVDLAQTVGSCGEFFWTKAPPTCLWRGAPDAAAYYVIARACGLTCVPATAAFTNPSTREVCCVQESVVGVVGEAEQIEPGVVALDWLLGVEERAPMVVDTAGRAWCVGPIRLGEEAAGSPPSGAAWMSKVDPERLLQVVQECGLDTVSVQERLAALRSG